MTIRNLDRMLAPSSVALFGASNQPGSVGFWLAENLANSFKGQLAFINPKRPFVAGHRAVASLDEVAYTPDLAVIAIPPQGIPQLIADLGRRGTRAAIVITAGVRAELKQQMLDAAKPYNLRILGPNIIGLMVPGAGLNASFSHIAPRLGELAFLSQSGALITGIVDWAQSRGLGFSHVVSLGDMADVDFGDMLDYLAGDTKSRAILIYMESLTNAAKFMSAARRAARAKPVVVVKSGRHESGAKAAASHTGALAGSDAAYDAAFRRAGLLRVRELKELFNAAEILGRMPHCGGDRLTILTNGGGAGVLATDHLADLAGRLAALDAGTIAALDAALPPTWSKSNPVDIIGDADETRYAKALEIILADRGTDAVLVINCPTAVASSLGAANAIVATAAASAPHRSRRKPLVTNWLGDGAATDARAVFAAEGIPTFETPGEAIEGFMYLACHARAQEELMRTPPSKLTEFAADAAGAERILQNARDSGRTLLTEDESKALLSTYAIPTVETRIATSAAEAREIGSQMVARDGAVVLKILSPDISHKSDMGGVRLGLTSARETFDAASEMLERIRRAAPDARITGFTVQPMIRRPQAQELIIGMSDDRTFGPTIMFGAGGTAVEVVRDTSIALPPLDMKLASELIQRTRVARLLAGYRDRPRADLDAVALTLVKVSQLIADHPQILELDINPLLADDKGVIALDARVKIAAAGAPARKPMALRPYPAQWEHRLEVDTLGSVLLRPIRPEDEALYEDFFTHVTSDNSRMRFFTPMKGLSHKFLARLTQIDYAREIAFVAIDGGGHLLGVARFNADPDYIRAEYGVMVRSDLKGKGLGWALMQHLIRYAKAEGLAELNGMVLAENTTMLDMCRQMGFSVKSIEDDLTVREVVLQLSKCQVS